MTFDKRLPLMFVCVGCLVILGGPRCRTEPTTGDQTDGAGLVSGKEQVAPPRESTDLPPENARPEVSVTHTRDQVPRPVIQPVEAFPADSGCAFERVQATVRTRLEAVTQCYRNALQNNPELAGRVKVELGIERGGRLVRRSIFESGMPLDVNACIIDALDGLEFSGNFGKPCVIIYPFVFSASGPK